MPVERRALAHGDALLVAVLVEEAELDRLGTLREDREVRAVAVPVRAERERPPRPDGARHAAPSGWSQTTPSGGTVTSAEAARSCHGLASASTAPRLPTPEPP